MSSTPQPATPTDAEETSARPTPWYRRRSTRLILLGLLVLAGIVVFLAFRETFTLEKLAAQETQLREFQRNQPLLVIGIAFLLYVLVTGLSLPGATAMSLVFAWYFGFWRALVLVSFASTTGATLAFLLSRYFLRDAVQSRFGGRLSLINENLERDGAFYLFTVRLIPAIPFFVINLVMGLTPIRTWTFWWVSQVGMLPGTAVYVYAGSSVPSLQTLAERGAGGILSWNLVVAFVLLGTFPLVVRLIMKTLRPSREPSTPSPP